MPDQAAFSDNPPLTLAPAPVLPPAPDPIPNTAPNPAPDPPPNPAFILTVILILTQAVIRFVEGGPLKVQAQLRSVRFRLPFHATINRAKNPAAFADDPTPLGVNKIDGAQIGRGLRLLRAPGLPPVV